MAGRGVYWYSLLYFQREALESLMDSVSEDGWYACLGRAFIDTGRALTWTLSLAVDRRLVFTDVSSKVSRDVFLEIHGPVSSHWDPGGRCWIALSSEDPKLHLINSASWRGLGYVVYRFRRQLRCTECYVVAGSDDSRNLHLTLWLRKRIHRLLSYCSQWHDTCIFVLASLELESTIISNLLYPLIPRPANVLRLWNPLIRNSCQSKKFLFWQKLLTQSWFDIIMDYAICFHHLLHLHMTWLYPSIHKLNGSTIPSSKPQTPSDIKSP